MSDFSVGKSFFVYFYIVIEGRYVIWRREDIWDFGKRGRDFLQATVSDAHTIKSSSSYDKISYVADGGSCCMENSLRIQRRNT